MKLKHILVCLLCFIMVFGSIPGTAVLAEEVRYDTIEEVLGVDAISSLNVWDFANSTMTTYTRGGYQSIKSPDGAIFTSEGLDLSSTNGSDVWKFSAFSNWSPVSMNSSSYRAVYFKVKGSVSTVVKTPDNYSIVKLNSVPGTALSSMTTSTGSSAVREVAHDLIPDNDWVEYLMVPRNSNAVYLWAKSSTLTDGKWVKVMGLDRYYYTNKSSEDYQSNRENGINFSGSGTVALWKTIEFNLGEENVFDQDARTVVLSEEEAKPEGADCLWFEEEFLKEPEYPNYAFGSAVSINGDGVASVPVKYENEAAGISATGGAVSFYDLEIPVDGYAEFKMKSNSLKGISFDDGTEKYEVTLNCDYSAIAGTVVLAGGYVADSDASWRTWRVLRTEAGYTLYSKTEGDSGWRIHARDGISGQTAGSGEKISLVFYGNCDGTSDGNGQLDYLKIYGPAPENALVMTDGYSTKVVDSKEQLSSIDSAYILAVCSPVVERKLIFAKYGVGNTLLDTKIVSVPMGTGAISVPYDLSDEEGKVREFKVFLWDGFETLRPASRNYTENGELILWTDVWEFGGNADGSTGALVLNSKAGENAYAESYAEWNTEIGDAFDISWTMEITSFNGSEKVEISTGSHCVSLLISADEIAYETNDGIKTTPWAIGNQKHQYRVIHNGGTCDLLIDGYHVAELTDIKDSTEPSKIRFQNVSSVDEDSRVVVESVRVDAYAIANIPVATQKGFYHSFDFADEAVTAEAQYERLHSLSWEPNKRTVTQDGVSVSTPFDENGNLITAWEIAEGNLQIGGFKPRTTTSTVQKYFKENVGDDYIFLTRMRIPEFGTTGQINLYLKNRILSLNLKQKFFGMRTAYSQLSTADGGGETAYSDSIMIDTEQWFDLRIETYDYCRYARIYMDDVKIMEAELAEYNGAYYAFNITSLSGWSEPFDIKFDYIKCAPINYQIAISGLTDDAVYQVGDSIPLYATVDGVAEEAVQYLMNGRVVATGSGSNHGATLTGLPAGCYEIKAVCGNKFSAPISFTVEEAEKNVVQNHVVASSNYANEVTYTATGDGVAEFCNGIHLLTMNHQDGKLLYETDQGTETYAEGNGDFLVITEGPVADVYRNGQFAFSFFMPMSGAKKESFTGNLTNAAVSTTPERKTYFSANDVTVQKQVYELSDLSHSHVLDFVAGKGDVFHLALNDGYYRTNVSVENGELYVWNGQRNNSPMEKTKVASLGTEDTYYRVETSAGMSRLYANGRWVTTFRGAPTVGKDTLSVDVTAGSLTYLAVCDNTDLYLHQDDFSGNREDVSTDYWMLSNGMTATVDSTKAVLSLESSADNGIAELSSSCGTVDLSAKVIVESGDGFWFVVNHTNEKTYTKVGYQDGKYQIVDVVNTQEAESNGTYQETITETVIQESGASGILAEADMRVQVVESAEGKKVTLFVDGTEVISGTTEIRSRGKVGFMLANGKATIDNVAFRGDAKPVVGFSYFYAPNETKIMDMIEVFDVDTGTSEVYIVNGGGQGFATTDGGKTWSLPEPILNEKEKTIGYFWPETGKKLQTMSSNSIYQFYHDEVLENGKEFQAGDILAIREIWGSNQNGVLMEDEYGQKKYATCAITSNNYGESWNVPSFHDVDSFFLKPEEIQVGEGATVNALKRGASGRFYFVQNIESNEDYGGARVWWSDDTENWTPSKTKISAKGEDFGFVIAEAVVIETGNETDGYKTRLYFRTDMGSICYLESPDRGVTWDSTPHSTPFISSACCFNIEADPMDESGNTLYMAWSYDNTNLFARHQFPRTRASVAKSIDGGETWEMIGTVRENTSTYQGGSQNMNISVSSQHVYVTAYTSEQYGKTSPFSTFIASFPKDSQKTSKRFEQLHLQYPTQADNTKVMPEHLEQKTMAIHSKTGAVWIHGKRFENAAFESFVDLECAASLVGATVKKETDSVIFQIGDAEVSFSSWSLQNRDGVWFVRLSAFANEFDLTIVEEKDVKIVSENKDWSQRQRNALCYAVDLFRVQP